MQALRNKRKPALLPAVLVGTLLTVTICLTHRRREGCSTASPTHSVSLQSLTSSDSNPAPLSCGSNCLVGPERLLVVSIGSLQRPEYLDSQRSTIGSLVPFEGFTEADVTDCVVCNVSAVRSGARQEGQYWQPTYDRLFHGLDRHRDQEDIFFEQPTEWWCAQKRNLPAVRLALKQHGTLPDFMLVLDDDTFVHLPNLLAKLKELDATSPVFWAKRIYDPKWQPLYIMGGGGWLVSRAILESILQPFDRLATSFRFQNGQLAQQQTRTVKTVLDVCIDSQNGGSWCFDHSDHAIPHCIYIGSQTQALSQEDLHQEACRQRNDLPNVADILLNDTSTWSTLLTCHYADPQTQSELFAGLMQSLT